MQLPERRSQTKGSRNKDDGYGRKAANERLTVEETDKALRLARIATQAERVFGAADKAHRWLREPKRALQGETPVAYLATEAGARVVEEMLYRIEYGMFA